ncbi:MAG: Crp/Fnr family transcriptional regulator [Lewinellaceae bacterium]|nr:Crp/Fnr family transcriptional regulator [Lewinellaceae bacterium]
MYERLKANLNRHIKLDDEAFDLLRKNLVAKTYKKDSHLIQSGHICKYTYFVHKGLLRLYDINEKGLEKNTLFAIEEWWVSDLYSFHSQKPGNYFLQALEDTEVLQLSKHAMENLLLQIPKLERFFRILHINAFIAQQERVMFMISKTAEERYRDFIQKYPDAEQRIPQKQIASYLGITPEFLSRMKANLRDAPR